MFLAGWLGGSVAGWLGVWLAGWVGVCIAGWLAGWMAGWGRLAVWLCVGHGGTRTRRDYKSTYLDPPNVFQQPQAPAIPPKTRRVPQNQKN